MTEYQFYNLLDIFKDNRDMYVFIILAYYTGMRANGNYFINLYNTKNHKDNLIPCTIKLNSILKDFTGFILFIKQI